METGAGLPAKVRRAWLLAVAAVPLGALTIILRGADMDGVCWGAVQAVLVVVAVEDLRRRRIPNAITGPAALAAIGLRIAFERSELVEIIVAGAASFSVFLVFALLSRGGLGMGDVKLAGLLGLLLGAAVVPALLLGSVAGGIASVVLLSRTRERGRTMAYGPYLCVGGALAILALSLPRLV